MPGESTTEASGTSIVGGFISSISSSFGNALQSGVDEFGRQLPVFTAGILGDQNKNQVDDSTFNGPVNDSLSSVQNPAKPPPPVEPSAPKVALGLTQNQILLIGGGLLGGLVLIRGLR